MSVETRRRRADDLIRRCYAGLDATSLQREVLQRLPGVVPVDAAFSATVDPATMLFTSVVSEAPLIEVSPQFLANELGGTDVNRFVDLAVDPVPVRYLDEVTGGQRLRSVRYASIMQPLGFGDELRVALRTGDTCWGVMCLHREDGPLGFDAHDVRTIARLVPHIAEGLRRAVLASGFTTATTGGAHGVVVIDEGGAVVSMNDAAERWLADIADDDWPPSVEVPVALMATARAAANPDPGETAGQSTTARLRTVSGQWLSIHASRLNGTNPAQSVVVLEPAGASQLTSLILDAHAVTGAQARVVALVLRGYSTKQIVQELHISAHTIQEHLTAVFDKLGVRSRRELAAALLTSH